MVKHFIVLCDYALDGVPNAYIVGLSHSITKAEKIFKKEKESWNQIIKDKGFFVDENSDTLFESYEKCRWAENHIRVRIIEQIANEVVCNSCGALIVEDELDNADTDYYWSNDGDRIVYHICPKCGESVEK